MLMMRRRFVAVLLLACAFVALAPGAPPREFSLQKRMVPGRLQTVRVRDLDGDGILDLLYVAREGSTREVGYFRGRPGGGFDEKPAHRLRLKRDVVLVGVGDLDPAPGVEFVLFTPSSVFVYRHAEPDEARRYHRLFRETLFFSFADPDGVPIWSAIHDLDGDGLEDICVPAWDGYAIRFQTRNAAGAVDFETRQFVSAWVDRGGPEQGRRRMNLSISTGGQSSSRPRGEMGPPVEGYMVQSVRRMSAPMLVDENGDGRLDLMILEGDHIKVWRQGEHRSFARSPDVDQDVARLLESVPRWSRSGNLLQQDLDGDGRLDFLVRQSANKNLRTRLLAFTGGLASLARAPRRILVLNGLTAEPRFLDVNGDKRLDLLVPTYRLDLLERARKNTVRTVDVTLHVFLNRPEEILPARPDYSWTETLRTDRLGTSGVEPMLYLDGDFNRDGRADLLVLDQEDRLKIFLSTETTGGLFSSAGSFTFHDEPAVSIPVEVPRSIQLVDQDRDGVSEVLLLYERSFSVGGWGLSGEKGR